MLTSIYTKGFHVLQATGCRPQAASCKLQATVYRRGPTGPLGVSGYKPGATGSRLQAAGCKLQATSIMFGVGPRGSFRYVGGLSESVAR